MTSSHASKLPGLLLGKGTRHGLWLLPLLLAIVMALWLSLGTAQFARSDNLSNLVSQGMPLLITAVGQTFVILVGGLDLSVGSIVSFTTAILSLNEPAHVVLPAVFLLAAVIGLLNGFCITRLNVHALAMKVASIFANETVQTAA